MKLTKVIFASDDSHYLDFWPLQAKMVKRVLGLEPVLFRITENETDFFNDGHGTVKHVNKNECPSVSSAMQAQIIRMYGTKYFPTEVCITGDIDMLMLNRDFFVEQIKEIDNDSIVIYDSDAYSLERSICLENHTAWENGNEGIRCKNRYPLCYIAGSGRSFDKLLNTSRTFSEYALHMNSLDAGWDTDEIAFGAAVDLQDHGLHIVKLKRFREDNDWGLATRIDRNSGFMYELDALKRGEYVDAHCPRPYTEHVKAIEKLANHVLDKEKNLIVISAYCDTSIKEDQLRNLVLWLSKEKSAFDIMVVSHTPIPIDIARNCDYAIFDKKNERLEDLEAIGCSFYSFADNRTINSIYTSPGIPGTYHVSVWRMLSIGNIMASNLGYNKVHHIEYDTKIESLDEIHENSLILDDFDAVIYLDVLARTMCGCYMAYRLDRVTKQLQECNEEYLIEYSKQGNIKNPETLYERMLRSDGTNVYEKKMSDLAQNGIHTNLSMIENKKNGLAWCLPFYNAEDNSLGFFICNDFDFPVDVELIYNGTLIKRIVDPNVWHIFPLDDNYENAKKLTSIVNGKIHQTHNFDEVRDFFKMSSYLS